MDLGQMLLNRFKRVSSTDVATERGNYRSRHVIKLGAIISNTAAKLFTS
jgi:hypothetical protein